MGFRGLQFFHVHPQSQAIRLRAPTLRIHISPVQNFKVEQISTACAGLLSMRQQCHSAGRRGWHSQRTKCARLCLTWRLLAGRVRSQCRVTRHTAPCRSYDRCTGCLKAVRKLSSERRHSRAQLEGWRQAKLHSSATSLVPELLGGSEREIAVRFRGMGRAGEP